MSYLSKRAKIDTDILSNMSIMMSEWSHEEKRACYKILRENLYEKEEKELKPTTKKKHDEIINCINQLKEEATQGNLKKYVSPTFYYDTAGEICGVTGETAAIIYRRHLKRIKKNEKN